MDNKQKKSLNHFMRALHRDLGFIAIGITIIFCLSGIILIYRDTDLLKFEKVIERKLEPNMELSDLGRVIHVWDIKEISSDGEIVSFNTGTYNKATGDVKYTTKELPGWLNKFNGIHTTSSRNMVHWITVIYGIILLFLAISSFWMFKPETRLFRRGMYLTGIGICVAVVAMILMK